MQRNEVYTSNNCNNDVSLIGCGNLIAIDSNDLSLIELNCRLAKDGNALLLIRSNSRVGC